MKRKKVIKLLKKRIKILELNLAYPYLYDTSELEGRIEAYKVAIQLLEE